MKTILSSSPLLITAAAIAIGATVVLFNITISAPAFLSIGLGVTTCAGLLAMSIPETRANHPA